MTKLTKIEVYEEILNAIPKFQKFLDNHSRSNEKWRIKQKGGLAYPYQISLYLDIIDSQKSIINFRGKSIDKTIVKWMEPADFNNLEEKMNEMRAELSDEQFADTFDVEMFESIKKNCKRGIYD